MKAWWPANFAPWVGVALVFWPIMAYLGGQGFTAIVAVAITVSIPYLKARRVPAYLLVFVAFVAWVIAASTRAPGATTIISGNLLEGNFGVDLVGARFSLVVMGACMLLWAARWVPEQTGSASLALIRGIGLIQGLGVLVTALGLSAIISLITMAGPATPPETMQNLLRNANAYMLLLPYLLAWLWHTHTPISGKALSTGLLLLSVLAFAITGTQTALFGAVFMLCAMVIVRVLPRHGFKALFTALATYVAFAPVLLGWGLAQLRLLGFPMPASFFSRSYSWELVGQKIAQEPWLGHGVEAAQTWRDTYGDHPAWLAQAVARGYDEQAWSVYRVIPSHPHNMALQVWAETGGVGALLLALTILLFGWRLRAPKDWSPIALYGAAGLVGAVFAIFSFAYSMWNEAFWAGVAIASAVVMLQARYDGAR